MSASGLAGVAHSCSQSFVPGSRHRCVTCGCYALQATKRKDWSGLNIPGVGGSAATSSTGASAQVSCRSIVRRFTWLFKVRGTDEQHVLCLQLRGAAAATCACVMVSCAACAGCGRQGTGLWTTGGITGSGRWAAGRRAGAGHGAAGGGAGAGHQPAGGVTGAGCRASGRPAGAGDKCELAKPTHVCRRSHCTCHIFSCKSLDTILFS